MALVEKQISNHPILGLKRKVQVIGFNVDDDSKTVSFYHRIKHYSKEDDEVNILIPNKTWQVDNTYLATVRDEQFQPVSNPNYDEEIEGSEPYQMMPAYDYFKQLTFDNPQPVSISFLLNYYIQDNDSKGFFDFY